MNKKYSISLALSLLFICFNAVSAQENYMFRGNPELTANYNIQSVSKISGVKFTFQTEGAIHSTPVIANSTLYFGSTDGNFYAVDAQSGVQKWKFKTGGAVSSSPAIANDKIWFTSRDGYLYSLDASSGNEIWKFQFGKDLGKQNYWDYYLSSPNIVDNILYIGSGDGNLYAIDINSKSVKWKHDIGSKIRCTPAVSGDMVFFGGMDGNFYAVSKNNGEEKWKFATSGASIKFEDVGNDRTSIFCSPSVSSQYGVVIFGGRDGFAYALNTSDGKLKWNFDHKGSWVLSTAIKDDNAYVGSGSASFIQCVDINTGQERWHSKTKSAVFSSMSVTNDAIYFADFFGTVCAIDSKYGEKIWSFPLGSRVLSTPVISDGVVYCSSDDGILYALQGTASEINKRSPARKIVYFEGNKSDRAFSVFPLSTGMWIRDFFKTAGYELMDAGTLAEFMKSQLDTKTPSVVVFADNKIPFIIANERSENALIRKYLNANGKVVLFGVNPTVNIYNDTATGILDSIEYETPGKIFGVKHIDYQFSNGYYPVFPTVEGKKVGLKNSWAGFYAVEPNQVTTVLATDEFGMAAAWLKNYGGPEGTGLLQLTIARPLSDMDLGPFRRVIEYGIDW